MENQAPYGTQNGGPQNGSPQNGAAPSGPSAPSFDVVELVVLALGRFRYQIILCAVVGLAYGTFQALTLPNVYASSGKLLARFGKRERITPESVLGGMAQRQDISMTEEVMLLRSPELFRKIATEVGPERLLDPWDPMRWDHEGTPYWKRLQHRFQSWWFNRKRPPALDDLDMDSPAALARASGMAAGLAIKPDKSGLTQVLTLRYVARSPELAHAVVKAGLRACQERHAEVFQGQFGYDYARKQIEDAQEQKEATEEAFLEHRRECGWYDIETQRKEAFNERRTLREAQSQADIRLLVIEKTKEHLEAELATLPETILVTVPPQYAPNPIRQQQQAQIKAQRSQLALLPIKLREESEQYAAAKERIEQTIEKLEAQLDESTPFVLTSGEREEERPNPRKEKIQDELRKLDIEKVGLEYAKEKREVRLTRVEEELREILKCEPLHLGVRRRIQGLVSRVGQLRSAQAKVASLARLDSDESLSNLILIQDATYSPRKAGPKRAKLLIVGLGMGFGAGIGLALLRQFLDSKVRFPRSVERSLGVRILGVVPEQPRWRRMGKRLQETSHPS